MAEVLGGDEDLRYAFRHGAITAEEVLAAVRERSPELAEKQPQEMRLAVFSGLLKENGDAAMRMTTDVPEKVRWQMAVEAWQTGGHPEDFVDLMATMPPGLAEETWDQRLESWKEQSLRMTVWAGVPFVTWVEALPPGQDRDMAIYHLAVNSRHPIRFSPELHAGVPEIDPDWVDRLVVTIRDPRLREKLEEGK